MSKDKKKALRVGLLLTTGALFVAMMAAPATAAFSQNQDNSQLISRLDQLENQVQTLSRSVYKGGPMPEIQSSGDANGGSASAYEDRISALEQQQRQLTGKIEQMSYDVQQLKERLDRQQADSYTQSPAGNNTRTYPYGGPQNPPPQEQAASDPYSLGNNDRGGPAPQHALGTMGGNGATSADALYEDAFSDISGQKYESAAAKFQRFMTQYPTHPLASNAQYWLGETYFARADYKQSAKVFAQGYQDYPQGSKAAASLLKLGMSLARLNKKDDACLSFSQLKKEFPGNQTPEIKRAQEEMKQLGCAG